MTAARMGMRATRSTPARSEFKACLFQCSEYRIDSPRHPLGRQSKARVDVSPYDDG